MAFDRCEVSSAYDLARSKERGLFFNLVLAFKAFYPACGIDDLLLAGEERVAFAAKLHPECFSGRAGGEGVAARAYHLGVRIIFWVYLRSHLDFSL